MKKIIKKIGNSLGITFDAEDKKIYGMKEGDVVDLTNMHIVKPNGLPSAKGDELG